MAIDLLDQTSIDLTPYPADNVSLPTQPPRHRKTKAKKQKSKRSRRGKHARPGRPDVPAAYTASKVIVLAAAAACALSFAATQYPQEINALLYPVNAGSVAELPPQTTADRWTPMATTPDNLQALTPLDLSATWMPVLNTPGNPPITFEVTGSKRVTNVTTGVSSEELNGRFTIPAVGAECGEVSANFTLKAGGALQMSIPGSNGGVAPGCENARFPYEQITTLGLTDKGVLISQTSDGTVVALHQLRAAQPTDTTPPATPTSPVTPTTPVNPVAPSQPATPAPTETGETPAQQSV